MAEGELAPAEAVPESSSPTAEALPPIKAALPPIKVALPPVKAALPTDPPAPQRAQPDPPAPPPEQAVTAPTALVPTDATPCEPPKKPGWWARMKGRVKESLNPSGAVSKMLQDVAKQAADDFVDKKVVEIRATADQFTKDKVNEIKAEAHMLISHIEAKIDQKINEIEKRLDERIAKEMEWRLKSLVLTLVFVFAMTLISLGYFALKKKMGW